MSLVNPELQKERAEFNLAIFVVATLAYNLITLTVNMVMGIFLPNTPIDTVLCLLIYLYLLFRALPTMIKRISVKDFIFILLIAVLILLSMLKEENFSYIFDSLSLFPKVILYYFVGRSVLNDSYIEKLMFKATPYVIFASFILFFLIALFAETQNEDNMSLAYYLLPFTIFSAFKMIKVKEKRLFNIAVFIGALFLQIWTGTRGPLICLFVAMALYILINPGRARTKFLFALIVVAVIAFLSSNIFTELMQDLSAYLGKIGVSNRIVDKFLEEELLDTSGRDNIAEKILLAIKESPLFGYGFFGDRAFLNGQYCHNIFYEFLINFGILFGGIMFISLVGLLVVSLFRRKENPALFLMLLCAGFVKLFLSSSYIIEPMFFMLLGTTFRKNNAKQDTIKPRSRKCC